MSFEFEQPENLPEEIPQTPVEEHFEVGNLDQQERDELRALLEEVRKNA